MDLVKRLELPASAVHIELKKLEKIGFLLSKRIANIVLYKVNKDFALYPELKGIVYKTIGLSKTLRDNLCNLGAIEVTFIYGSVAKDEERIGSDIDLMVIGNPDMDDLCDVVCKAERALVREVNYTVFGPDEWQQRVAKRNSFVMDVLRNSKIYVIGDEDKLQELSHTKEGLDEDSDDLETEEALCESQKQFDEGDVGTEKDIFKRLRKTSDKK